MTNTTPKKQAPKAPKAPKATDGAVTRPRRKRATPAKRPAKSAEPAALILRRRITWLGAELLALVVVALVAIIAVLGRSADWFRGTGFGSSLLPFAGAVLLLVLIGAGFLRGWWWGRAHLGRLEERAPALAALVLALAAVVLASRDSYDRDLAHFRTLLGGTEEAERMTLSHQVYAAYRRSDLAQMQRMLDRAQPYLPAIEEAASRYGVDLEVLMGVGAAESSFIPRDSKDGGRGLFQITAAPKAAMEAARRHLGADQLDMNDVRHNSFVAAATLSHYFAEMRGDLFLGLLAYNIGPKNGGLLSIMQQYGARDFATIQPYLQNLPRDYPIRVLTAALAYRLWRVKGQLPRYEEGDNAQQIQGIGIPGLPAGWLSWSGREGVVGLAGDDARGRSRGGG